MAKCEHLGIGSVLDRQELLNCEGLLGPTTDMVKNFLIEWSI